MTFKVELRFTITVTETIMGMINDDIVDEVAYNSTERYVEEYLKRFELTSEKYFIDFDEADIELISDDYRYDALSQGFRTEFAVTTMCGVHATFKDKTHFNKAKLMNTEFANAVARGEIAIEG